MQHFEKISGTPQCGTNAILDCSGQMIREFVAMVISGSASEKEQVGFTVRNLVAARLHVNLKRVTDEARLVEDLGADWLDHLELMMAIEDQFGYVEIGEDQANQIVKVSDIIRFVETHHH
jgi:acyl carrier protein